MDHNRFHIKRQLISASHELDELSLWVRFPLDHAVALAPDSGLQQLQADIQAWGVGVDDLRLQVKQVLQRYLQPEDRPPLAADVQDRLDSIGVILDAATRDLMQFLSSISSVHPYDLCVARLDHKAMLSREAFQHYSVQTRFIRIIAGFPDGLGAVCVRVPETGITRAYGQAHKEWQEDEKDSHPWARVRMLEGRHRPVASTILRALYEYGGLDWEEIARIRYLRFGGLTSDSEFFLHFGKWSASSQGLTA